MIADRDQAATMTFFRFSGFINRAWAMKQMYEGKTKMKQIAGLEFFRILGTGGGAGYSLWPDFGTYAIFAVWESYEFAKNFNRSLVFQEYTAHSEQQLTVFLSPVSSRGSWSGFNRWRFNGYDESIPWICAITRATIKVSYLPRFWSMVPRISREHEQADGIIFSKGVGEYPVFEQATFTIWKSRTMMDEFARRNTHLDAIVLTRKKKGFREEMFARFQPVMFQGNWEGLPDKGIITGPADQETG